MRKTIDHKGIKVSIICDDRWYHVINVDSDWKVLELCDVPEHFEYCDLFRTLDDAVNEARLRNIRDHKPSVKFISSTED